MTKAARIWHGPQTPILSLALLSNGPLAAAECGLLGAPYSDEVEALTESVATITGEIATKVLSIKVNYDGTVEEFNKGQSVAFEMEGKKNNPLILKAKPGTVLSKANGGSFVFSILTDDDPVKYTQYPLSLVKAGANWKVMKGDKAISSTVISPNISWSMSWEGTFKSASFK